MSGTNVSKMVSKVKVEEFPALSAPPPTKSTTMNFASLFKNAVKKKPVKKMKWGMVRLTKKGVIDSLTPEEYEAIEKEKTDALMDERLWNAYIRHEKTREIRREFDTTYESPPELSVTSSEEEVVEEDEVLTDEVEEDEFEPEI
jgi:hypothetical protein